MDLSGNKRPNNPASIQSDAAGSPEKPIYQGKDDAHHYVPADEDRDALPYSESKEAEKSSEAEKSTEPKKEERAREQDGKDPKKPAPDEDQEERGDGDQKPKDDVHSAPESGDKLP